MTTNPTGVMRMTTSGRFTEFAMPGDDIVGITTARMATCGSRTAPTTESVA